MLDRLNSKIKEDGNLNELTKMANNDIYSLNIKKTLSGISSLAASEVSDLGKNGNKITYKYALLDNKVFLFDSFPIVGKKSTLSLDIEDTSGIKINWSVTKKPKNTILNLIPSRNKASVAFIVPNKGSYTISITATKGDKSTTKSITFNVLKVLAEGIRGPSVDLDPKKQIGIIENQSWVSSKSLDENKLTTIIELNKYNLLTKKGYDSTKGLLIEYEIGTASKKQLNMLKFETGVDNVYNRVYHNDKAFTPYAI